LLASDFSVLPHEALSGFVLVLGVHVAVLVTMLLVSLSLGLAPSTGADFAAGFLGDI
jgi:hypothetical protein